MNKKIGGFFDGGCLDTKGHLWWAIGMGSKLIKIDPSLKKVVDTVALPTHLMPSSVAFGGKDYKTMLVTSIGYDGNAGKMVGGENGGIIVLRFKDGTKGLKPGVWKGF